MDRILDLLAERKLTKAAFAELVGIKSQNVNAMLKNPTKETYEKISAALKIPMWQLFASPSEIMEKADPGTITCPVCQTRFKIDAEEEITD